MAYLDAVLFRATSSGAGDFVPASAIQGYQLPITAGAADAVTYYYRAESDDLTQWEYGYTVGSSTATSFTRVVVSNSLGTTAKISFTIAPKVGFTDLAAMLLSFDSAMSLTNAQKAQARANLGLKPPTIQSFTSGSGTYTKSAGVTWIEVFMVGGGAGGGSSGGNSTAGGNTTFSTFTASGGGVASTSAGGAGGAASGGDINIAGGAGGPGRTNILNVILTGAGGVGGSSYYGGAGTGTDAASGSNAATNSGSGGGGASNTGNATGRSGCGGGSGGFVYAKIDTPSSTYSYAVGAGGAGSSNGVYTGGSGAAGLITVIEHYD